MKMDLVALAIAGAACACGTTSGDRSGQPATAVEAARPERSEPPGGTDPWAAARERGIEFRALGQEPGWYLEMDEGASMRLVYDYSEREATTPMPQPVVTDTTRIYDAKTNAHHLRVVIEEQECSDTMSGLRFPRTVTVTIDGRALHGCGREL